MASPMPVAAGIFFILFSGFIGWYGYLWAFRRETALRWFFDKPMRMWGLQVSVVNQQRFRNSFRVVGLMYFVLALILVVSAFWCLFGRF